MDEQEETKRPYKGGRANQLLPTVYRQEAMKQRILELYLDASSGKFRTYEDIANEMGIDRATVWRVMKETTKEDLEQIVPVWATNLAVREYVHGKVPKLINRMADIAEGKIPAPATVQLKAIDMLLGLAGVSAQLMQQQGESKQQNNAIMVSVTVGGVPQKQDDVIEADYNELD